MGIIKIRLQNTNVPTAFPENKTKELSSSSQPFGGCSHNERASPAGDTSPENVQRFKSIRIFPETFGEKKGAQQTGWAVFGISWQ